MTNLKKRGKLIKEYREKYRSFSKKKWYLILNKYVSRFLERRRIIPVEFINVLQEEHYRKVIERLVRIKLKKEGINDITFSLRLSGLTFDMSDIYIFYVEQVTYKYHFIFYKNGKKILIYSNPNIEIMRLDVEHLKGLINFYIEELRKVLFNDSPM